MTLQPPPLLLDEKLWIFASDRQGIICIFFFTFIHEYPYSPSHSHPSPILTKASLCHHCWKNNGHTSPLRFVLVTKNAWGGAHQEAILLLSHFLLEYQWEPLQRREPLPTLVLHINSLSWSEQPKLGSFFKRVTINGRSILPSHHEVNVWKLLKM